MSEAINLPQVDLPVVFIRLKGFGLEDGTLGVTRDPLNTAGLWLLLALKDLRDLVDLVAPVEVFEDTGIEITIRDPRHCLFQTSNVAGRQVRPDVVTQVEATTAFVVVVELQS